MAADSAPLTLGTAGHIDHGKTAVVRALTGHDTDRLPEERRRGISIELGYAPLRLPGGRQLSLIDVPGHERFVRTMVAGATGIDLFLLCVAADDGVMPQTREHAAVLRRLGVGQGVVAVTKADLADPGRAQAEAAELVPGAETVSVCATEREGIGELLAAIERVAEGLPERAAHGGSPRLHVDRCFSLRGIGTVVTGTLWSGELAAGDRVVVLPSGRSARVRSLEVHGEPLQRVRAGQRVALALSGLSRREVARGDVVCPPGTELTATYLVDGVLELELGARPLNRGARVQVHHGTRETAARVVPLEDDELAPGCIGMAQLRLEQQLLPAPGDRFVLRQLAPPDTIGGGVVLDPGPRRHGGSPERIERLRALARGERPAEAAPKQPLAPNTRRTADDDWLDEAAVRMVELLLNDGPEPRADGELAAAAGLEPRGAARRLRALEGAGRLVRVAGNLHFHPVPLAALSACVVSMCERDGAVTIAQVRDELGTSRRYAQALLEHLNSRRVTRRQGDAHVLRPRAHG